MHTKWKSDFFRNLSNGGLTRLASGCFVETMVYKQEPPQNSRQHVSESPRLEVLGLCIRKGRKPLSHALHGDRAWQQAKLDHASAPVVPRQVVHVNQNWGILLKSTYSMTYTQWISLSAATTVPQNLWDFTILGKLSGTLLNPFGSETVSKIRKIEIRTHIRKNI